MMYVVQIEWNSLSTNEEQIPEHMQDILNEFRSVFDIPKELPPIRAYDHKISFIDPNPDFTCTPFTRKIK